MRAILIYLMLCTWIWADAFARSARITTPPMIDGSLNETAWNEALVITDFKQRFPTEGGLPTERTEVRLLYTTSAIYIGVRAYDTHPQGIVGTVMKRDDFNVTGDDQFAVAIDSYNDGRNGFWFSTNPLGVRVDAQFFDEGDIFETNWNGIWECKTRIDRQGWTAEIEIPFSTLHFHPAEQNIMGINFFRRIIRTNEQLFSPLIPRQYTNGTPNVSVARKYIFEGIHGGKKLQIKPYALSRIRKEPASNANTQGDLGLDVRYGLSSNLTANVSLHTDFAEAEVDDRQINLTRFRLFFPEKREFFLENSGYFTFGAPQEAELFFSRRIGLVEETGEAVPILLGAKLTGKFNKIDLGLLDVQTDSTLTTPRQNFGVVRIKAGLAKRSYIGTILTNQGVHGGSWDRAMGVDWNLYFWKDITFNGFAAVDKSTEHDASPAYSFALTRGGELTSFHLGFMEVGSLFDPQIGFIRRPGTRKVDGSFTLPHYLRSSRILSIAPSYEMAYYDGVDGPVQDWFHRASLKILFQSNDQITAFVTRRYELIPSDFPIFRDVIVPAGPYRSSEAGISLSTKPGRKFSTEVILSAGGLYGGSHQAGSATVVWKISPRLSLSESYAIDHAKLPSASFQTHLLRSGIHFAWNTQFSADTLIQYDNATREFNAHLRLSYLFREGTQLFFVYGDTRGDSETQGIGKNINKTALLKLTYLFQF